jgi:hypothetical protein
LFTDSEPKKRSGPERTGIPPHKDNATESQRSSSRPSKPDKAPVVKSTDKNRGQSSHRRVKAGDGDVRYMVFHWQYHHQMLTLDETTLFFWNLSNEARARRAGVTAQTPVANWVAVTVPGVPPPPVSQLSTGTQSSRAPSQPRSVRTMSAHSSLFQSSRSALSTQVSVKGYARAGRNNEDEASFVGGLSDHDELEGDEFKDAQNSPVKGKCRVNSKVSFYGHSR